MIILQETPTSALADDLFRTLVDGAPTAMAVLVDGACVYANARFAGLRGCQGGTCARACGAELVFCAQDGTALDWQTLAAAMQPGQDLTRLVSLSSLGAPVDAEIILRSLSLGGRPVVLVSLREVAEETRMRRLLDHLAFHDPLTELPNRALLFDRLSQALSHQRRQDGKFAVLVLDLDGFKAVNDHYGHAAGDEVLCAVGRRLLTCVRDSDTVARMGGDEFTVLLHGIRGEGEAARVAGKILRALSVPFMLGEIRTGIGASIGIALCPAHGVTLDGLLAQADQAMYHAKEGGKCSYAFCGPLREIEVDDRAGRGIPWVDEIALGHEILDRQHRTLVECVNRIIEILAGGRDPEALRREMDQLARLTAAHFEEEERLMDTLGADALPRHRESHLRLLGQLRMLTGQVENTGFSTAVQSIRDWLLEHIRGDDRELVAELRSRAA